MLGSLVLTHLLTVGADPGDDRPHRSRLLRAPTAGRRRRRRADRGPRDRAAGDRRDPAAGAGRTRDRVDGVLARVRVRRRRRGRGGGGGDAQRLVARGDETGEGPRRRLSDRRAAGHGSTRTFTRTLFFDNLYSSLKGSVH